MRRSARFGSNVEAPRAQPSPGHGAGYVRRWEHGSRRTRVSRARLYSLAAAALAALALSTGAGAQDETEPPCPPGVPAGAAIHAIGAAGVGGPLIATQTIFLEVETSDRSVSDFKVELPPGVVARRGSRAFQADAPGPVHVRATWSEFDPGSASFCQASAEATFELLPARPLRYFPPSRRSRVGADGTVWILLVPDNADLRPVEVRLRGVQRARAPRASDPLTVVTFALRDGDKGLTYDGRAIRIVRSGGWHFDVTYGTRAKLVVQMRDFARRGPRGYGIDLKIIQAGRQIGQAG